MSTNKFQYSVSINDKENRKLTFYYDTLVEASENLFHYVDNHNSSNDDKLKDLGEFNFQSDSGIYRAYIERYIVCEDRTYNIDPSFDKKQAFIELFFRM